MSTQRSGFTILELIIVLAILAVFVALLFPAVQSAREKAREAACRNNLHQMNIAVAEFVHAHDQLPALSPPGIVGGWSMDILPFLEQKNLAVNIAPGMAIPNAPATLLQPPSVMRCPSRPNQNVPQGTMSSSHYVLVPVVGRKSFLIYDAPLQLTAPWASGPEMTADGIRVATGPHHGGLFYVNGFQEGAGFLLNGQEIQ